MKKETIITAAVFLGVGFLAGYVYNAQRHSATPDSEVRIPAASQPLADAPPAGAATADTPSAPSTSSSPAGTASPGALPPGHPPVDPASTVKLLEDQAAARPNDPSPPLELANYLYDQKQFEQAIPWYQKALALDPKNVNARTDLGTSYYSLGRTKEAAREYQKSLEVDPNHQPTLYNLALVSLEGTHDLAVARDALARLTRLNPSYPGLDKLKQTLSTGGKP
ncbi:MAG TPA: tetratricopeptide repeat protein [Terriglobia bacterium]|nr:tetratricopeptide repeat protein [Terriglobia bacterium]